MWDGSLRQETNLLSIERTKKTAQGWWLRKGNNENWRAEEERENKNTQKTNKTEKKHGQKQNKKVLENYEYSSYRTNGPIFFFLKMQIIHVVKWM